MYQKKMTVLSVIVSLVVFSCTTFGQDTSSRKRDNQLRKMKSGLISLQKQAWVVKRLRDSVARHVSREEHSRALSAFGRLAKSHDVMATRIAVVQEATAALQDDQQVKILNSDVERLMGEAIASLDEMQDAITQGTDADGNVEDLVALWDTIRGDIDGLLSLLGKADEIRQDFTRPAAYLPPTLEPAFEPLYSSDVYLNRVKMSAGKQVFVLVEAASQQGVGHIQPCVVSQPGKNPVSVYLGTAVTQTPMLFKIILLEWPKTAKLPQATEVNLQTMLRIGKHLDSRGVMRIR